MKSVHCTFFYVKYNEASTLLGVQYAVKRVQCCVQKTMYSFLSSIMMRCQQDNSVPPQLSQHSPIVQTHLHLHLQCSAVRNGAVHCSLTQGRAEQCSVGQYRATQGSAV